MNTKKIELNEKELETVVGGGFTPYSDQHLGKEDDYFSFLGRQRGWKIK